MTKKIDLALLIDDDEVDNQLHKRVLEKSGHVKEVSCFSYAEEALEYLRTETKVPCAIFLDINMPRMNGFEFLAEYKKLPETCKAKQMIVLLTTSASTLDHERAKKIDPAIDFHSKPLKVETVNKLVELHF